jgi:endo-1,4-beta-D-glucanase Y
MKQRYMLFFAFMLIFSLALQGCSDEPAENLENTLELCFNGVDDDVDGKTDCEDDDCNLGGFCTESSEASCSDLIDNDDDEVLDCEDPNCSITQACAHMASSFQAVPTYAGLQPQFVNHERLQSLFENWVSERYEENADGSLARIKRDNEEYTVSEGIAYGMLIFLAMDETADRFAKLWEYYKAFRNDNGVMNWCIEGFEQVAMPCDHNGSVGSNGATDAELDAVTALIHASVKWGRSDFMDDASALAQAIWNEELDLGYILRPGDAWGGVFNPSYFSPAAIRTLQDAFPTQGWDLVLNANYAVMELCRNQRTGLHPDWCNTDGSAYDGQPNDFTYEAVRVPWRLAWATLWYDDPTARSMNQTLATWVTAQTEGDYSLVKSGYTINGQELNSGLQGLNKMVFCMATGAYLTEQEFVNTCYDETENDNIGGYYKGTLHLLGLLTYSGKLQKYFP